MDSADLERWLALAFLIKFGHCPKDKKAEILNRSETVRLLLFWPEIKNASEKDFQPKNSNPLQIR